MAFISFETQECVIIASIMSAVNPVRDIRHCVVCRSIALVW